MRSWFLFGVLAVLSLLALQGYYIHTDVQRQYQILEKQVNAAFRVAVEEELSERRKLPVSWLEEYLADTTKVELLGEWNEAEDAWDFVIKEPGTGNKYMTLRLDQTTMDLEMSARYIRERIVEHARNQLIDFSLFYYTDEIGNELSKMLSALPPDTVYLKARFREELALAGIDLPFNLRVSDEKEFEAGEQDRLTTDTLPNKVWEEDTYVTAIFSDPFTLILGRIRTVIILSALIIVGTILTYWWLVREFVRQKRLVRIKDDFIDQVTHEFKTPLSTLRAANEALVDFNVLKDREKTFKYLEISKKEILRLSDMVETVLTNSVSDKPGFHYAPAVVDMIPFIQEVLHTLEVNYEHSIPFSFNPSSIMIKADPVHFRQLLTNLIDNALLHNPSPDKKVWVDIDHEGNYIRLNVSDNGPVIPENMREKIFEKYSRLREDIRGYGIGLYYVKNVLTRMDSRIILRAGANGNTFTIYFPGHD